MIQNLLVKGLLPVMTLWQSLCSCFTASNLAYVISTVSYCHFKQLLIIIIGQLTLLIFLYLLSPFILLLLLVNHSQLSYQSRISNTILGIRMPFTAMQATDHIAFYSYICSINMLHFSCDLKRQLISIVYYMQKF